MFLQMSMKLCLLSSTIKFLISHFGPMQFVKKNFAS